MATAVLSVGALTAALLTTGTAAIAEPAGTSHPVSAAHPAGVPWSHVGPGWVLAQYTTAAPEGGKTGPVTLYLISPGGARYQLARWPDFRSAPELVAWSPDGKRVLFQVFSGKGGTEFAAGTSHGIKLVSNRGSLIRQLPLPRTSANTCSPVRWWNSGTVLASCAPRGLAAQQLWLVPVSGAHPKALTPPRNPARSGDFGDLDAWQLPSGLYLQAAGACGVLHIYRQASGGSIKLITVPHTNGDNRVLTARGSWLLVQAPTDCTGSVSLLWYDPGTRAEQWLIRAPGNVLGVANAVPFYSRQNGNL